MSARAIALLFAFAAVRATAQSVSALSGGSVTIDVGERQGVRAEMTGRFCKVQKIAGKSVEVCPATFRIASVSRESSVAEIVRGDASQVERGFRATFDQRLVREISRPPASRSRAAAPMPAVRDADPVAVLADAELAFDRSDSDKALDGFRRLLKVSPDDEYLAWRTAEAAQHVTPPRGPAKAASPEETSMMNDMAAAGRSGHADIEKRLAATLLARNPENVAALAVRARDRAIIWGRARAAAEPWQRIAAWEEHVTAFPGDAPAQHEIQQQIRLIGEGLAKLADETCSVVAARVNFPPTDVRKSAWFRSLVEKAGPSWKCPFVGMASQSSSELKLVVVTLRQPRPLPGATFDTTLAGTTTIHHPLAAKECSAQKPCEQELAFAAGEKYQIAIGGGPFRGRSEPAPFTGPADAMSLCINQKMTHAAVEPCATAASTPK